MTRVCMASAMHLSSWGEVATHRSAPDYILAHECRVPEKLLQLSLVVMTLAQDDCNWGSLRRQCQHERVIESEAVQHTSKPGMIARHPTMNLSALILTSFA